MICVARLDHATVSMALISAPTWERKCAAARSALESTTTSQATPRP